MKIQLIIAICAFAIVFSGCHDVVHETIQHNELQEQTVTSNGSLPAPMPSNQGPDWMNETVVEIGQGAVNPRFANNPGQAKLMAKRAAIADARRMLLERVLGLRLDASTVVRDMVAESDAINAETSGFLRESRVLDEDQWDGNVYTVKVELKLYSVYTYMKTNKIYYE